MTKEIPLAKGYITTVDDCDYDFLMQWKWYARQSYKTYYAVRSHRINGIYHEVRMHRVILQPPSDMQVDHRDRNGLNNTRLNLRICNQSQNKANSSKYSGPLRPGTSPYKGVFWNMAHRRWVSRITVNNQRIHIGNFAAELDAARAYDAAALKYFGEFAYLNFLESE